jgi:hypothetical protein
MRRLFLLSLSMMELPAEATERISSTVILFILELVFIRSTKTTQVEKKTC